MLKGEGELNEPETDAMNTARQSSFNMLMPSSNNPIEVNNPTMVINVVDVASANQSNDVSQTGG